MVASIQKQLQNCEDSGDFLPVSHVVTHMQPLFLYHKAHRLSSQRGNTALWLYVGCDLWWGLTSEASLNLISYMRTSPLG